MGIFDPTGQGQPPPQGSPARTPPSVVVSVRPAQAPAPVRPQPQRQPQPPAAGAAQAAKPGSEGEEASDLREELVERATKYGPPWFISAAIHFLAMIILGLWVVTTQIQPKISLRIEPTFAEQLGDQLEFDSPLGQKDIDNADAPVITPQNLPEVADPLAAPGLADLRPDGSTATSNIAANQIGLALMGRNEGSKKVLLGKYGGSATSEVTVKRALEWLARRQQRDGSWSLCGPYKDGVEKSFENPQAATAMALLAFQGHGDTHLGGDYQKNVANGWKWLLKQQDEDGNFYHEGSFNNRYYTQGQCTIALCELLGMTKDQSLRDPAMRALQNCLSAQSHEGGWRYSPNTDSDVSVTGWIVMAMQSAKMAGLEVPEEKLKKVSRFLDSIGRDDGSRYPYRRGDDISVSMTAEALLCRQYLGWRRNDPRMISGMKWVTAEENLIDFTGQNRNVYYWYYATQACHHFEGEVWKKWNAAMLANLPRHQTANGSEAGSWDPNKPTKDKWAEYGGRLFVTCLSTYMLEVYYRHLPIYTQIDAGVLK